MMRSISVTLPATTGGAGTATATAMTVPIQGVIHMYALRVLQGTPAGTVTITLKHPNLADRVIHNAVAMANGVFHPIQLATGPDGNTIAGQYKSVSHHGHIQISVAGSNNGIILYAEFHYADKEC